jgi:hypothetical protein
MEEFFPRIEERLNSNLNGPASRSAGNCPSRDVPFQKETSMPYSGTFLSGSDAEFNDGLTNLVDYVVDKTSEAPPAWPTSRKMQWTRSYPRAKG